MKAELSRSGGLANQVANSMAMEIVEGNNFFEGRLVTETIVAQEYGVSRTVAREAVKKLIAKGLVASRQRSGIAPLPFSSWNLLDSEVLCWIADAKPRLEFLRDFAEFRLAIEPEAAYLAARDCDVRQLGEIESAIEGLIDDDASGEDATEHDLKFHMSVLKANKNSFYNYIAGVCGSVYRVCIANNLIVGKANLNKSTVGDHKHVFDMIKARKPDEARKAMYTMLQADVKFLQLTLQASKQNMEQKTLN